MHQGMSPEAVAALKKYEHEMRKENSGHLGRNKIGDIFFKSLGARAPLFLGIRLCTDEYSLQLVHNLHIRMEHHLQVANETTCSGAASYAFSTKLPTFPSKFPESVPSRRPLQPRLSLLKAPSDAMSRCLTSQREDKHSSDGA